MRKISSLIRMISNSISAPPSQEIVAQRLAAQNKRAVGLRLEELMKDTKFTKEEIRMMYRGFKQVRYS